MKRFSKLYERVCSYDNLLAAADFARRGKLRRRSVVDFYANIDDNLRKLHGELEAGTYRTSEYRTFTVSKPKERVIHVLPFRDRIVHWAIMLIVAPIWTRTLTADTYSCITGRGIHAAFRKLKKSLMDVDGTRYCLKLDVRKFYPTIDHALLKQVVRMKIKDIKLLALIDGIIDSVGGGVGIPIGSYLSQFFANLYLSELDHLLKEVYKVKYYYRYADDIAILDGSKERLHGLLIAINDYLTSERGLALRGNYQVFPVAARGIDFVGYVFRHTHVLARKKNKQTLARKLARLRKQGLPERAIAMRVAGNVGFIKHSNSNNLLKKLSVKKMKKFSEISKAPGRLEGSALRIDSVIGLPIRLLAYQIGSSKHNSGECLTLQFEVEEASPDTGEALWQKHIAFTGSTALIKQLDGVAEADLPCEVKIVKQPLSADARRFFYKFADN